jgi:uncharacterized protein (DUF1501 family)
MKRRNFLKLTSSAAIGTPFLLNGTVTQAMNNFLDAPINCANINDRVLVIVRLAGANDGLNTVVPISQYNTYANLRPDIRIQNTGVNSYINLDNTLQDNQLSGLHPSLTGFKSLYDSGKLSVINGVGYPTPNLSHFKSENTMFAGKDGTSNNILNSGVFGRYLSALYPGLGGAPTAQSPDPLAIQLGNTNPNLFYGHNHDLGIEYNVSNFQDTFFTNLSKMNSSIQNTEYQELLNYITTVEGAMDTYYNKVQEVFNAGANSSITYPDTDLGKQLKTVARMIQGGSKTKIFQVNLGGFDTHVNQVESGNSHVGTHATLVSDISNSIAAFQNDIEALGINNKIMTVTFSEFGRQVKQNGNLGTDHGTLSPFFVVGSSVEAGVYGSHPIFTDTTSFQYEEKERKYDYRQLFATLMQDWLGADNGIMQEVALHTFSTSSQKIPLINAVANAYPSCLVSSPECEETIKAVKIMDDNGWSYYAASGTIDYLFAIEHLPIENGANTNDFEAEVIINKVCNPFPYNYYAKKDYTRGEGVFVIGEFWNLKIKSGNTNGWVNVRWFTEAILEDNLNTLATEFQENYEASNKSPIFHFLTNELLEFPNHFREDAQGLSLEFTPLLQVEKGTYLTNEYTQYDHVLITNTIIGGSKMIKLTSLTENELRDSEEYAGMIRYNSLTNKIEGFDGVSWKVFH